MGRALTKSPIPTAGETIKSPLRGKPGTSPVALRAKLPADKNPPVSNGGAGKLRGTARLFTIIELLAARPGRIVDVTKELGLPWATAHRSIAQLAKANFLRRARKRTATK